MSENVSVLHFSEVPNIKFLNCSVLVIPPAMVFDVCTVHAIASPLSLAIPLNKSANCHLSFSVFIKHLTTVCLGIIVGLKIKPTATAVFILNKNHPGNVNKCKYTHCYITSTIETTCTPMLDQPE